MSDKEKEAKVFALYETEDQMAVLLVLQVAEVGLPLMIGSNEAQAIMLSIQGQKPLRPMTHDLIVNILAGLLARVERVRIYKMENDIFYGELSLLGPDGSIVRIDARPSDCVAIALRVSCPIIITDEVLSECGQPIEKFHQLGHCDGCPLDGCQPGDYEDE